MPLRMKSLDMKMIKTTFAKRRRPNTKWMIQMPTKILAKFNRLRQRSL